MPRIEPHIKIYIPLIVGFGLGPKNNFLYNIVFALDYYYFDLFNFDFLSDFCKLFARPNV